MRRMDWPLVVALALVGIWVLAMLLVFAMMRAAGIADEQSDRVLAEIQRRAQTNGRLPHP